MKRILLDQGLAPATASILNASGWDAVHVSAVGLECAEDAAILAYAELTERACVTFDHDFHMHLALASSGKPSVIFLREESLGARDQVDLIVAVWAQCENAIDAGAAVSASLNSVRTRRLPLR